MATDFNPADAVDQADLEAQHIESQAEAKQAALDAQPEMITFNPNANEAEETTTDTTDEVGVAELIEDAPAPQEQEEVHSEAQAQEIEDVIDIEETPSEPAPVEEPVNESGLPEWIEKLKAFHEETGGGLDEYQNYIKDFDALDDNAVLKEYYKLTKPTYSEEDIDLLIQHKFGVGEYGEGEDLSQEDKLKMLAKKDELFIAKEALNSNKEKYYADLKSGVHGAPEQYKEAVEFYNKAQASHKEQEISRDKFLKGSEEVFSDDFKGFVFEGGGKKFRLSVGNPKQAMNAQLDINQVLSGFVGDDGNINDLAGYHKAVWAAMNADKIFNAAYEQGKSAALKERAASTKNPSYNPQVEQSKPSTDSGRKVTFLPNQFNNEW